MKRTITTRRNNPKSHKKRPPRQWFKNKLVDVDLCPEDFEIEMSNLLDLYVCLMEDVSKIHSNRYTEAALAADIQLVRDGVQANGIAFLCNTVPGMVAEVLRCLETGIPDFSCECEGSFPRLFNSIIEPIFLEDISDVERRSLVRSVLQLGTLLKKLKGPYPKSVVQQFAAGVIDTDKSLGNLDFSCPTVQKIIVFANYEISKLLENLDPYDPYNRGMFVPRPGPGSVAKPVRKRDRFAPTCIHKNVHSVLSYFEWFNISLTDAGIAMQNWAELPRLEEQISVFEEVPKTYGTPRGICKEENEVQVIQQAFRRAIYQWVENHPMTRGRVNFSDQRINAKIALTSSRTKEYATLDMKDGSNRVTRALCYQFFENTTLWSYINALSTRKIVFKPPYVEKETILECNMMAPMGSALCFPIMSLVHYFLCRSIIRWLVPPKNRSYMNDVYVYGDDIIVPSEIAPTVMCWLEKFGLKVNTNKSYVRSSFRESCGVQAFDGEDITPVYVRDVCQPQHSSPEILYATIAAESGLTARGYYRAALWVREHTHAILGETLPEVIKGTDSVGWMRDTWPSYPYFKIAGRKWNWDLQQWMYRVRVFRTQENTYQVTADRALLHWLWMQPRSSQKVKEDPVVKIRWVWATYSTLADRKHLTEELPFRRRT